MPTILVQSPISVTVDGVNFGAVADTIKNNPALASEVQRALEAWFDDYKAQVEVVKTAADGATAALKAALADAQKALADKNAQVSAGIATIQSIVADPDTDTEKGIIAFLHEETKDERTKHRESLVNQKAEIDKQLAELV